MQVAETTVKRLPCCEFRSTGKANGELYQCWWRICRELNVSSQVRISHAFFLSICDLFSDSPSYYSPFRCTFCLHLQGWSEMIVSIYIGFVRKGLGGKAGWLKKLMGMNIHVYPFWSAGLNNQQMNRYNTLRLNDKK
jgi:hypothetical protein